MSAEEVSAPSKVFSRQLKGVRERRGWSQQVLADRVGDRGGTLDRVAIAKIERGGRGISLDEAFLLAAALEVSPSSLMLPHGDDEIVALAPKLAHSAGDVRAWLEHVRQLPGLDENPFLRELPLTKFKQVISTAWYTPLMNDFFAGLERGDGDLVANATLQLFNRWQEGKQSAVADPERHAQVMSDIQDSIGEHADMKPRRSTSDRLALTAEILQEKEGD